MKLTLNSIFALVSFTCPFFSFLNFLPLDYTLIKWEALRAAGGGRIPGNKWDSSFTDSSGLTYLEASVSMSPTALLDKSQPQKLTQGQKGLF